MRYALGLDNGGTMIKAALFDETGRQICSAGEQTPVIAPKPGYMERDMDAIWQANCSCIRKVLDGAGVPAGDIVAVGVAGHGKGLYACDENGRPAYNGIGSNDNRAWRYPEKLRESGVFERIYPQLCQQLLPTQQAMLLAWMKDNRPQTYHSIRWVFSVKDYIRFRLTGEAYCEATDISGSGLMDVKNACFDEQLLSEMGIGEVYDKLAPIKYSYEQCGCITKQAAESTGLAAGTPVAGGMFDIDACAVAMDITSAEQLCTITGTWSINEFIAKEPLLNTAVAMNSLFAVPGYYLIEDSSPTGAGNLEWALENLMSNEPLLPNQKKYHKSDELAASVPPDADVYFLPFLYGSNDHPLAKASFIGLTSYHSRAHMLRAVYEAAAFTAKVHIEKLLSVRTPPPAIRMAGGAANSPVWVQMFADILGFPIETVSGVKELGAMGVAMAAFVAVGVYPDYMQAAKAMVKVAPALEPRREHSVLYEKKFETYKAITQALSGVWNRFEIG